VQQHSFLALQPLPKAPTCNPIARQLQALQPCQLAPLCRQTSIHAALFKIEHLQQGMAGYNSPSASPTVHLRRRKAYHSACHHVHQHTLHQQESLQRQCQAGINCLRSAVKPADSVLATTPWNDTEAAVDVWRAGYL
jgi:hypothetical protein